MFKDKLSEAPRPRAAAATVRTPIRTLDNMDWTDAKRAERNADGVVFYKIWNGRRKPKVPASRKRSSAKGAGLGGRRARAVAAEDHGTLRARHLQLSSRKKSLEEPSGRALGSSKHAASLSPAKAAGLET